MVKLRAADAISVIANIGVLAGLGFLGWEINQNTQAIEGATLQALSEQSVGVASIGVENRELRVAFARQQRGVEYMTPEDASILAWWYAGALRIAENRYQQASIGTLGEDFNIVLGGTAQTYRQPFFGQYWRGVRSYHTPDFAEWVDANLIPLVQDSIPPQIPDLVLPEVRDALPREGSGGGGTSSTVP